jgi:transcriptional regulator with XRE-family HTH domain
MKKFSQTETAQKIGVNPSFISLCMNGHRRPSWRVAKQLAEATNTTPEIWLEGTPDQIRNAITGAQESYSV